MLPAAHRGVNKEIQPSPLPSLQNTSSVKSRLAGISRIGDGAALSEMVLRASTKCAFRKEFFQNLLTE
jgi:hypothetical protein